VVSKRFVKRQQMEWRQAHAHGLLQVRTAVLNEQLRSCFERWYPALAGNDHARHVAVQSPRFGAVFNHAGKVMIGTARSSGIKVPSRANKTATDRPPEPICFTDTL
jgi:hypothetical protein